MEEDLKITPTLTFIPEIPTCRICNGPLEFRTVQIGPKGLRKLIFVSNQREDGLFSDSDATTILILHEKCRASYANDASVAAAVKKKNSTSLYENNVTPCMNEVKGVAPEKQKNLRPFQPTASSKEFDFENYCIFCANDASNSFIMNQQKKPVNKRITVRRITKPETKNTVLQWSLKYDDQWCMEVRDRIRDVDLVTVNAKYHMSCFTKFITANGHNRGGKRGRPECPEILEQMKHIYQYLESNIGNSHFSIQTIREALQMELPSDKTIKRKLEERYGDKLKFFECKENITLPEFVSVAGTIEIEAPPISTIEVEAPANVSTVNADHLPKKRFKLSVTENDHYSTNETTHTNCSSPNSHISEVGQSEQNADMSWSDSEDDIQPEIQKVQKQSAVKASSMQPTMNPNKSRISTSNEMFGKLIANELERYEDLERFNLMQKILEVFKKT